MDRETIDEGRHQVINPRGAVKYKPEIPGIIFHSLDPVNDYFGNYQWGLYTCLIMECRFKK